MNSETPPPVCDYEGSDYQTRFWDKGERAYEDGCEAIALRKLLPLKGKSLLEVGAGAGRNTSRYSGYDHVVLLDYSRTQLQQAYKRLGNSKRYTYVVADVYRMPFVDEVFDAATMIRVLHHMADAPEALRQIKNTLLPGAKFILEYANKRNLKAILRYFFRKQDWNPFSIVPVEFAPLNFDFHPKYIKKWMQRLGFHIEQTIPVSHFRIDYLKKHIPLGILLILEKSMQWMGKLSLSSPSIFLLARREGETRSAIGEFHPINIFKCPNCGSNPLETHETFLFCGSCNSTWPVDNNLYIFRKLT